MPSPMNRNMYFAFSSFFGRWEIRVAAAEKPEGYVEPERKPRGDRGPRRENDRRDNGRGPRRDDRGPRRDDRGPRGPRRDRRDAPAENNEQNNEPEMF